MDSKPSPSEDLHAFTADYILSSFRVGHPFSLPNEMQDQMAYVLAEALNLVRKESKLGNRWSEAQLYGTDERLAHFVDSKMAKTGARCQMTIYAGSVSMEFTLPHLNELPSMDSRFWSRLASVVESHELSYVNTEIHEAFSKTAANKDISKFAKSPVFAFLTQFHLVYQHDPAETIHLGNFEKTIYYLESSWPDIITAFTEVFKEFSGLAQALYRSYYIKASKDPERRLGIADMETVRKIYLWIVGQTQPWTKATVKAEFPAANEIDILAAHDLALERDIISTLQKPFHSFARKRPEVN